MSLGIYLHIPFCKKKCPYCDFYSICNLSLKENYVSALIKSIEFYSDKNKCVDSIYFGGGTPSLLSTDDISSILHSVQNNFHVENPEITLEANPSSLSKTYLERLLKTGVNRLSIGVQSLDDNELSCLGRLHSKNQAISVIEDAKSAGFKNISADLMIGISHQTDASLIQSIEKLSELGVTHISSYLLKIEENTHYYEIKDKLNLPDDDEMADRYLLSVETLSRFGYKQYEISNFSKEGFESKHNLKYWRLEEYLGLGPGAHSFYNNERFYFERNLNSFLEMARNENFTPFSNGAPNLKEEYVMLSLRLHDGISLKKAKELGIDTSLILSVSQPFIKAGYMILNGENLYFTPKGFLVSNEIISKLI